MSLGMGVREAGGSGKTGGPVVIMGSLTIYPRPGGVGHGGALGAACFRSGARLLVPECTRAVRMLQQQGGQLVDDVVRRNVLFFAAVMAYVTVWLLSTVGGECGGKGRGLAFGARSKSSPHLCTHHFRCLRDGGGARAACDAAVSLRRVFLNCVSWKLSLERHCLRSVPAGITHIARTGFKCGFARMVVHVRA